ncbi:MAG: hypothetical protein J6K94_03980 [Ruminiclostridium sp.]|nr:hypothetical protein [Ruminiclostridium sp.]
MSKPELLAQLAEEAVELSLAALDMSFPPDGTALAKAASKLAHSALKLRRSLSMENPTPVSTEEASLKLQEEVADVLLCLDILGIDVTDANIDLTQEAKIARWIHRLKKGECEC